jgi:HEAT repeat protein
MISFTSENAVDVRSNIVFALGMFNSPQTKPLLEDIFNRDNENKGIRQSAAQYLARLPGGIEFLSDTLNSDSPGEEKQLAVEGLAFSENKQSGAAVLTDFLENWKEDGILRRTAAKALGALAVPDSVNTLITILQGDPDFRVRNASAQALAAFKGNNEILSALGASLHNDKDPTVRAGEERPVSTCSRCGCQSAAAIQKIKRALEITKALLQSIR